MMNFITTVLAVCVIGCRQPDLSDTNVQETHEPLDQPVDLKYPEWLTSLYPNNLQEEYRTLAQEITLFERVNDSVTFCIINQKDGVCLRSILAVLINERGVGNMVIGHSCDHDQSRPEYTWKEYSVESAYTLRTTEYKESVHDSLIDENGLMKVEYDDVNKTVDTSIQVFLVTQIGEITEIRIWQEVVGKYHVQTSANWSGGVDTYLIINGDGTFKKRTPVNHFTDGSTEYGKWIIKNDSLFLICKPAGKAENCDKKYSIKEDSLCWSVKIDNNSEEYCFTK
ncbi:MAG: hypothetical protein JKY52_07285 [Flavobacteriales bacterium]|nr:hypothetical protein [Flavobacteriales bacterium]